ncbi:hypothetical protein [Streptomyces sp. NPDC004546]|uniref:hypothetical protein n=1 Tax=Streptomyces sp. NPDC004546 TaxID=3154282 RepID=UPI0033B0D7B8
MCAALALTTVLAQRAHPMGESDGRVTEAAEHGPTGPTDLAFLGTGGHPPGPPGSTPAGASWPPRSSAGTTALARSARRPRRRPRRRRGPTAARPGTRRLPRHRPRRERHRVLAGLCVDGARRTLGGPVRWAGARALAAQRAALGDGAARTRTVPGLGACRVTALGAIGTVFWPACAWTAYGTRSADRSASRPPA